MSIFAGVFSRRAGQAIPAAWRDAVRATLSRYPDDAGKLREFSDDRSLLVNLDVGALQEDGTLDDAALAGFVAGAPLLQLPGAADPDGRNSSLAAIARSLAGPATQRHDALRACRGTYCATVYEKGAQRLHLMTDKFGVRPVYCWISPDFIVFATALRIIEALPFCKKSLSLQGIAEISSFNFPLGDRTPYDNVICMLAGEVFTVDSEGVRRERYWRWDAGMPPVKSDLPGPERVYRSFQDAVRVRLGSDKSTAAFLSGGLDSRSIVAELRNAGAEVLTSNYAPPGSQDQVLGKMIADRLGTHHTPLVRVALVEGDPYSKATVHEWLKSPDYVATQPARPHVLWSGDGGSVGLGHVYLNQATVDAMREGNVQEAINRFIAYNKVGLSVKLFKPEVGAEMTRLVNQGMLAELQDLKPADPGRAFYLFLMMNDQRRHLFNHFETLDLTRIEFELPFFDGEFMADIMREPFDPFLRHAFYVDWLKYFQPAVLETPWQAYPNHVPCPHPLPDGLSYQWDKISADVLRKKIAETVQGARALLSPPAFAREFLGSFRVRLFIMAMRLTGTDYTHQLRAPSLLHRYWLQTLADGR